MEIPYLTKESQFAPAIETALEGLPAAGGWGEVLVDLGADGGYGANAIRVEITPSREQSFTTDWSGEDPTRFPARIRAAASALHQRGLSGVFVIGHSNGQLSIKESNEWTTDELRAAVLAYFKLLDAQTEGRPMVKAEVNRALRENGPLARRTKQSVEYRMRNISAVLAAKGLGTVDGYIAAENVGGATESRILDLIRETGRLDDDIFAPTSDPEELEARTKRLLKLGIPTPPRGNAKPKKKEASAATVIERDPAVRAWVLQQAEGVCELCGEAAPFTTIDGDPFLEVHHVDPLSNDGPDTVENAVALCPNCHRRCHYGHDRGELKGRLENVAGSHGRSVA